LQFNESEHTRGQLQLVKIIECGGSPALAFQHQVKHTLLCDMSPPDSGLQDPLIFDDADYQSRSQHESLSDNEQLEEQYVFDRPVSPFTSIQIDGLESLQADHYMNGRGQSPRKPNLQNIDLLDARAQYVSSPADLALSALQYLPYPLMVVDSTKTLKIANEAMSKLLGLDDQDEEGTGSDDGVLSMDRLKGQTLSQMGIDLLQDGRPIWVNWESFLDSIAEDGIPVNEAGEGDVTPTADISQPRMTNNKSTIQDAVVEVVITPADILAACFAGGVNKCL